MTSTAKKNSRSASGRVKRTVRGGKATASVSRKVTTAATIRKMGMIGLGIGMQESSTCDSAYAEAHLFPPHRVAVHGHEAIRKKYKGPARSWHVRPGIRSYLH